MMKVSLSEYAWAHSSCGTIVKIDVAGSAESTGLDDTMLILIINTVLAFVMLNKTNQQSDPRDTIGINSL